MSVEAYISLFIQDNDVKFKFVSVKGKNHITSL